MPIIPEFNPVLMLAVFLLLLFIGPLFFSFYCGLPPSRAFLAMLTSAIAGTICFLNRASTVPGEYRAGVSTLEIGPYTTHLADKQILPAFAAGVCIVLLAAFGLRLWVRWVIGRMTAEERLPGRPGIRASFCTSNVIVGLLIVALAWYGFDASPIVNALVIAALLAAYPLLQSESLAAPAEDDDLSAEREKIVAMLEAGKLTSEECSELLRALGETSCVPESRRMPTGASQRLMLLGAALVGAGFFLPWFVVNPGSELARITNQWQFNANSPFSGTRTEGPGQAPNPFPQSENISISGGDIQRGLGWVTLALALTAALLPYVASTLDAATARTVRLICLGSGGFIVLYLVTTSFRFVSIGLIIAIGGYLLEAAGALRERRTASL